MIDNPLISVVIPTYNGSKYITETIDSILAQTYHPIEIIVVDDGSTDNTKEVLASFMSKIEYIYQPNKGVSAARNTGIQTAKGEYIALLDADDTWLPTKIEKQIELFKNNPALDFVFSDVYQSFNGQIHPKTYWERNKIRPCRGDQKCLEQLFRINFIPGGMSEIFKRELIDKVGLFNENLRIAEDYEYWLRMVSKNINIDYINEPLAIYRMHEAQATANIDLTAQSNLIVLKETIKQNPDYFKNKTWTIRHRFFYIRVAAAYYHLKSGNVLGFFMSGIDALFRLLNPFLK